MSDPGTFWMTYYAFEDQVKYPPYKRLKMFRNWIEHLNLRSLN